MRDKTFQRVIQMIPMYSSSLRQVPEGIQAQAFDIHLKSGQPLSICGSGGIFFLLGNGRVTRVPEDCTLRCRGEELQRLFVQLCNHSVFSHETEIREGFIAVNQAYRVGISGTAVLEGGQVKNIRDIRSMVFRIPREKPGIARALFQEPLSGEEEKKERFEKGILIVGEPSSGKTTFLRDIIRSLSFGSYGYRKRVAVLDERCELESIFDLGPAADVYRGFPKAEGFSMALRTMSPELIVCDELSPWDRESVVRAMYCGVPVIATVHGSLAELRNQRGYLRSLLSGGIFETVVFLQGRKEPGSVKCMMKASDLVEGDRDYAADSQWTGPGQLAVAATKDQKIGAA